MEIEIRDQEKKAYPPKLKDMDVGTVIVFGDGVKAMIIKKNDRTERCAEDSKAILMLQEDNSIYVTNHYFEHDYKKGRYKVLGKISKIIVEEQ